MGGSCLKHFHTNMYSSNWLDHQSAHGYLYPYRRRPRVANDLFKCAGIQLEWTWEVLRHVVHVEDPLFEVNKVVTRCTEEKEKKEWPDIQPYHWHLSHHLTKGACELFRVDMLCAMSIIILLICFYYYHLLCHDYNNWLDSNASFFFKCSPKD